MSAASRRLLYFRRVLYSRIGGNGKMAILLLLAENGNGDCGCKSPAVAVRPIVRPVHGGDEFGNLQEVQHSARPPGLRFVQGDRLRRDAASR
jgi:hypothetical protein